MTYDVAALGELLIDFTESGTSPQGNSLMEACPGGAPCNVLAMLAGIGHKTAFIGKVGRDAFGEQLERALEEVGVSTKGLVKDDAVHTTLAIVASLPGGDRDFSFYRNPGADMMLSEREVDADICSSTRVFCYGTLSLTSEPVASAARYAIEVAEQNASVMAFDPNLRPPLWDTMEHAREEVLWGMGHAQVLKISDNEIQWLSGREDFDEGIAWLRERFDVPLILLTLGPNGSRAYQGDLHVEVPGVSLPETIETTGAGDCFFGSSIHYILEHGWRAYTQDELRELLAWSNAAAALVTTRKGALRAMPSAAEVEGLLARIG